jgi:hypothetical protein
VGIDRDQSARVVADAIRRLATIRLRPGVALGPDPGSLAGLGAFG